MYCPFIVKFSSSNSGSPPRQPAASRPPGGLGGGGEGWQSGEISDSRRGGRESGSSIPLRSAEAPLAHEEVLICSLQRVGRGGWGVGGVGRLERLKKKKKKIGADGIQRCSSLIPRNRERRCYLLANITIVGENMTPVKHVGGRLWNSFVFFAG